MTNPPSAGMPGQGTKSDIVVPERATPHEATMLVEDVTEGLVWPLILRGPALALRPSRVLFGVATVVVIGLIGSIGRLWASDETPAFSDRLGSELSRLVGGLWGSIVTLDGFGLLASLRGFVELPADLARAYPVSFWALGIPMFAIWLLGSGAIARSAACEAGRRPVPAWTKLAGFALTRWPAFLVAWGVPAGLIVVLWFLLAGVGWAMVSVPVLDVIAGVLYGLALVLGLIAVVTQAVLVLGGPLLVPAISAEGTDAIDGMQRAFGYVFGRPLRLVLYLLVACVCAAVAFALVGGAAGLADQFATNAITEWTSADNATKLVPMESHEGSAAVAARMFEFWRSVLGVLISGYVVSYFATAGTLVYLCTRRINDGQDVAEVWGA